MSGAVSCPNAQASRSLSAPTQRKFIGFCCSTDQSNTSVPRLRYFVLQAAPTKLILKQQIVLDLWVSLYGQHHQDIKLIYHTCFSGENTSCTKDVRTQLSRPT